MLLLGASVPVAVLAQEPGLDRSPSGPTNSLLDRAKDFLGTPYRYGGRSPKGFDCSGFVSYVFDSFGIRLPRASVYQAKQGESIDLDEIQPGDLLFFKTRGKKNRISHVGIYLGEGQFIHAGSWGSRKSRCVKISDLDGSYYVQRLVSARRVLGPASTVLDVSQQMLNFGSSQKSEARDEP
jgi:cell wall-associated NlpC family hydrolase